MNHILSSLITPFTLLLVILSVYPAGRAVNRSSDYSFQHIDNIDGLTANYVKCIVQDRQGFMWFGTKNGLNRYDGSTIRHYDCTDPELGLGNNNIDALYCDENSNLWIGTDRGIYIYNPHSEKISYVSRKTKDGYEADNWVQRIAGDGNGHVWALLPDTGIFLYSNDSVRRFTINTSEQFKKSYPSDMCVDSKGNVWIVTAGLGIYRYDPTGERFTRINPSGVSDGVGLHMVTVAEDPDGNILAGTIDGHIYSYNPQTNLLSEIDFSRRGQIYLRSLHCADNEIWAGAQTGLYIIDKISGRETLLKEDPLNPFSLSDNAVYCMYGDLEGGTWVGTLFGGVNYFANKDFRFTNVGIAEGLPSRLVIGLASDRDGRIWIGTETDGVSIYNPSDRSIKNADCFSHKDRITLVLESINGEIYASFSNNGLLRTSDENSTPIQMFSEPDAADNNVYSYFIDSKGNEWLGLSYALYRRDAGSEKFRHIKDTGFDWIYTFCESSDGNIWIGSMGNGIWRYNPANGTFRSYVYDQRGNVQNGLKSNSISSIMEDRSHVIWISTDRGGLSRYNRDTDDFTTFGIEQGLPDNVVYTVVEDNGGNLWFGTNNGLVRFTPSTSSVRVFTVRDGLPGNQFNYKGGIKGPDGRMYFGGTNGLVSFNPQNYHEPAKAPDIYFTGLKILNEEVSVNEKNSPLKDNIVFTDRLILEPAQSTFSLDVASMNYRDPGAIHLFYRLLPVSDEWIQLTNNTISFTNLASGNYDLEVKAVNGTLENVKQLKIKILAPWWKSTTAYVIYGLIVVLCIFLLLKWYRRRQERKLAERQEIFTATKEKELYRNKINFFTEIAHEIRTPLSLIDLPLEALEDFEIRDRNIKKYIQVSRQNVKRLLQLTEQLLDFQKIDSQKINLKDENVNICETLQQIADRFEPAISLKNRTLIRDIDLHPLTVATDREAFTKIISNLLNNALKYGTGAISLIFRQNNGTFTVSVVSEGNKITGEDREKIFAPFYQTGSAQEEMNGAGIGLPLSRSLATLLGGTLVLEESDDDINIFTLSLPAKEAIREQIPVIDSAVEEYMITEEQTPLTKGRAEVYSIILVEDNQAILDFMTEQLSKSFVIETASNGQEALEKIKNGRFDMIVTDIMMPVMDGLELCKAVKEDMSISHIPLIFITAKNDLATKIRGLQYGAEAYVEKPFSIKYLRNLIRSIIENRRRERDSFSKNPFFSVDKMQMNKADEEFMAHVTRIIEENVSEDNFNVETMCDLLCMSRSTLLRKIKTIFNLSPIELIREIKLKKAAELIREGNHLISDVCFLVGITSPSYFSKLFYKQFGISPKDFEKQCKARKAESKGTVDEEPLQESPEP